MTHDKYTKTFVFIIIYSVFQNFVIGAATSVRENDTPKIEIRFLGNAWKNISASGSRSYHSDKGDDLFLTCQASYPIKWVITGVINPPEIVKILPPRRDVIDLSNPQNDVFKISVNIFFLEAERYDKLAASALIKCESVKDDSVRDQISVFVKGNDPFVELLEQEPVVDSNVIPCPTTDPVSRTTLHRINDDATEISIHDVTYDPLEGFKSNKVFIGNYVCRKGSFSVAISATTSSSSDTYFSPSTSIIRRFSDEIHSFKCKSKSNSVNIVFDISDKVTAIFKKNADREKEVEMSAAKMFAEGNDTIISGKVKCETNTGKDKFLVKEWSLEIIKTPELYLDNIEGEADCISTLSPKLVQTVRCKSSMDCDFMSRCLHNVSRCNYKKQKQFYATTDTFCWIDEENKGKQCVSVPFSHLNGIAQCDIKGLTRKWEFFISLDYVRYTNWRDVPKRELVRLEEIEVDGHEGNPKLLCTASAYLFADSLIFQFEYKNGTKTLTKGQDKIKNEQSLKPSSHSPKKIDELNVKAFLELPLPADVISVSCIAPFWNSTEYVITKKSVRSFSMKSL